MKKRALFLSLLSLIFIAGCGGNVFEGQEDKGSTEAKQFDISEKLDSGDYLAVLNDPNATATDYAAAAMGLAGFDPVDLIQAMNDAASGEGTSNDLSAVTALNINPYALQYLQEAEELLSSEQQAACFANSSSQECQDLSFQMTLTSLTSTITAMAQVGQENVFGFDATDGISEAEATTLGDYVTDNADVQVDTDGDGAGDTSLVAVVAGDIVNVIYALPNAGLGDTSDLKEVLTDATTGPEGIDPGGDGVSPTDISNYLTSVIGQ